MARDDEAAVKVERWTKMLRTSMHPATPDGEALVAVRLLGRLLRREGLDGDTALFASLSQPSEVLALRAELRRAKDWERMLQARLAEAEQALGQVGRERDDVYQQLARMRAGTGAQGSAADSVWSPLRNPWLHSRKV